MEEVVVVVEVQAVAVVLVNQASRESLRRTDREDDDEKKKRERPAHKLTCINRGPESSPPSITVPSVVTLFLTSKLKEEAK